MYGVPGLPQLDIESQMSQITESRLEEEELIHVEGTVIHHFVFAVRQDTVLAKELLTVLRIRQCSLSPFELALLLSLVRIDRYSNKACEMLRKAFLQDFAHQHKIKSSGWISTIDGLRAPSDMRQLCARVVRRSVKGWDHVVPGIVSFAMSNLEWGAKKCSLGSGVGRPSNSENAVADAGGSLSSACNSAAAAGGGIANGAIFASMSSELHRAVASQLVLCCLGILEKMFRQHNSVRDEILGQIFSRVLTRDESVKHFVHLLSRITSRCSKDVLDCLPKIKESLEYVSFMPPATVGGLISALEPVLRQSSSLLDYLIIILRKALFSREEDARMVAVQGFLLLAQGNLGAPSAPGMPHEQDPLALEMIGQLRRTMTQQVQMRERLYDGLCDVVRAKPYLIDDVASALFPQLQKCCHSDGSGTHIQIEKCVDNSTFVIVEPIGKLLRVLALCVALKTKAAAPSGGGRGSSKGKEAAQDEDDGVLGAVRSKLDALHEWISSTDPEDFDMDKETDFSSSETQHQSIARLVVGMHEVLFEHAMLCPRFKAGQDSRLFRGIKKMHKLLDLVSAPKPSAKGAGKGRKGSTILDDRTTLFSADFARRLLEAESAQEAPGGRSGHVDLTVDSERALRKAIFDDDNVMTLALETAQRQLLQAGFSLANTSAQHGDIKGDRMHIIRLAPLLLRQFYANLPGKRCLTISAQAQLWKGRKTSFDKDTGAEMSLHALHCLQVPLWVILCCLLECPKTCGSSE
jgi:hypothetical protein